MYIYYLKGIVGEIQKNLVVMECGGVGYECVCSAYTIAQLKQGEAAKLFTSCSVREDALELFGFCTREEKDCFEKLTSVSGVGPKAAIAILSAATPSGLKRAIFTGDEKALTAAPGVGKKLAQRVILELKDKLGDVSVDAASISQPSAVNGSSAERDAVLALTSLGYSQAEIGQALKGVKTEDMQTEAIIRYVLRAMVTKG